MKNLLISLIAASALLSACQKAEPPRQFSQEALDKALSDPARKDQRDAADARRKPGPLIALAEVKPGDQIRTRLAAGSIVSRVE